MICKWCITDDSEGFDCGCKEIMECDMTGTGHTQCGVMSCGCPKFMDHDLVKCASASKTFKWQKARMLHMNDKFIWVENKKPEDITVGHADGEDSTLPRLWTNHLDSRGLQMTVVPQRIELIAEFSNDIEMVKWGD